MDLCKGRLAIIQREKTFDNRQIRKKIVPEKKKNPPHSRNCISSISIYSRWARMRVGCNPEYFLLVDRWPCTKMGLYPGRYHSTSETGPVNPRFTRYQVQ